MPDDRSKFPRPKSHWGDEQRAAAGKVRRKTPPHGYPVALIDPELTPPPVSVAPRLGSVEGRDTWPPGMRESVDMISDNLGELTTAVGRVWDARNDSGRIDKINEQLQTLQSEVAGLSAKFDAFIEPFAKQTMARMMALEDRTANVSASTDSFFGREWPKFTESVSQLNTNLSALVTTSKLLDQELDAIKSRVTESNAALSQRIEALRNEAFSDRLRIIALEQRNRDTDVGDARETALVKRRNRMLKAAWAALTAAGGAIAGWFAGR
jgi:archaellum component FlaC